MKSLKSADAFEVDLELMKKYDVPAPRYTSYPTARHFHDGVDDSVVVPRLEEQHDESPLSLYVHLPFCRKLCWYCACTKIITKDSQRSEEYLDRLDQEMSLRAKTTQGRKAVQMHLGGGTPTFLTPAQIRRLGESLHRHFDVACDVEAGVEIDPREFDADKADALVDAGFNRASLGIQDVNPMVQKAIHRIQPMEMNEEAFSLLRERGFGSINVDLIYGLPHQTVESYEETLDQVLELEPDRFAIYSYAHVPWVNAAQKNLERVGLPVAETKLRLLKYIIERLSQAGYVYIGMDHFARPDDKLAISMREGTLQRNFQGYSTHAGVEIVGLGMSAISQTHDMYFQNTKDLIEYADHLDAGRMPLVRGCVLTEEDRRRRAIITEVMCRAHLDFAGLSETIGTDVTKYVREDLSALRALEADGLVRLSDTGMDITEQGRLFLRNIAVVFDAYLADEDESRYSRTV
jgi:oxygen-independent coproporphyrinogen-3 oxidase